MMKRGLALLLTAGLLAGLTGCAAAQEGGDGAEKIRLIVWSPSNDQSKDSGEWLQTMCGRFADQHPEWDITFVYGVADEASAATSGNSRINRSAIGAERKFLDRQIFLFSL